MASYDDFVDSRGRLLPPGRARLQEIRDEITRVLRGDHDDNCGPDCRISLRGHDCCLTCNLVEDVLRAVLAEDFRAAAVLSDLAAR